MARQASITQLLFFGAVATGAWYLNKTGRLKDLFTNQERVSESMLRLRLAGFHAQSDGSVFADIEAMNPTSRTLQVKSIIGNFIVGGRPAGIVKMFGDQAVRANDQGIIPVSVRILPAAATMWRRKGQRVEFRGEINLNDHVLPLVMNYTL